MGTHWELEVYMLATNEKCPPPPPPPQHKTFKKKIKAL